MNNQVHWKKPVSPRDYENSLTDKLVSAPTGTDIVYFHGKAFDCPPSILRAARCVAARLRMPLVRQPQNVAADDARLWKYMVQKAPA